MGGGGSLGKKGLDGGRDRTDEFLISKEGFLISI